MSDNLIVHIVGARPNFIKLTVLYPELRKKFEQVIIHTGQHYDYELSRVFFEEFDIPEPDYNLDVGSGSHGYQVGEMLKRCEEVLVREEPRLIVVYGDTNSTLAGALASVKLGIPVAHVEAGVRSFERYMAEEVNRVIVDHISEFLFAPTHTAMENLRREGIERGAYLTGDVMLDLFNRFRDILEQYGGEGEFILVTIHRAENVDKPNRLRNILEALIASGEEILFPIHPRTRRRIEEFGLTGLLEAENIHLLQPLSYIEFLRSMSRAAKVVTDSGGVQKEAYFTGRPCITLREATEWTETVEAGWNILVGADREKITKAIKEFNPKGKPDLKIFGDGQAASKIARIIIKNLE